MDNNEFHTKGDKLLDACWNLLATIELAWAEKQLTAPRYVQCSLGTAANEARKAIAEFVGGDEAFRCDLEARKRRLGVPT